MKIRYKRFGVMIDCSRNAVIKVSALKKLIDCLEKIGCNMLELYTEDTYEVEGEPYFGYLRGRYSGDEIKEIDAYAAAHGLELVPCIQTLAHFTNPVKLPRFCEITDINDILLIDEEKTYEFIERAFESLAKNFTSRNVHIGMDEAHLVGLGKYLDKHGFANRFELLNRHLARVISIASKYGFKPHMWSDMFFRLAAQGEYYGHDVKLPPDVLERLPKGVDLVYWDYYHTEKEHYDKMFSLHGKMGREVWFAGGAWTWTGFAHHCEFTYSTMSAAMKSVRDNGIENVLVTLWGDNGGECPPFAALKSLYAVRRFADGEFDVEKISAEFEKLFGLKADFDLLGLPDTIPDFDASNGIVNPSKAFLYSDPFLGLADAVAGEYAPIPYADYAKKLDKEKAAAGEYAYLFDTASKLCSLLEVKAYLGVRTRKAYRAGDKKALAKLCGDYAEAETRLEAFYNAFCEQWHKVNKPFGFEVQCARIGGLKQRLEYCRRRMEDYTAGKTESIEELEEDILPFDSSAPKGLVFNDYRRLVTPGEL